MSPSQQQAVFLQTHPEDNVTVVASAGKLPAGTSHPAGFELKQAVAQGHKVALTPIPEGGEIVRYGVVIGRALTSLQAGDWVHESVMTLPDAPKLSALPMATHQSPPVKALSGITFQGFVNPDGSVGTRNLLAITTTVQCVAGVVREAVKRIEHELLPLYPNVDGVVGLEHTYGCGVAIDAPGAEIPIRTLRNISLNPNFGGEVLIVSLGCEKLQPLRLFPDTKHIPIVATDASPSASPDAQANLVCLQGQNHRGFMSMLDDIMNQARIKLERLNQRQRVTCPASELVVGVQCGGSDALSGLTANPVVGVAADLLVAAGATVMFSENTEVRDAVAQLTARSQSPQVAQEVMNQLQWYDEYLTRGKSDRSANTTPGNKAGGLSNIVEKAMGSVVKSGSTSIQHVIAPGEKLNKDQKGLVFAATPASDFICGTLQLAAGMNVHLFTTGRGTPYGLAACPVIKIATHSDLAERWHDLIDLNAGVVADGVCDVQTLGRDLFEHILRVASGESTWAERWKLHNDLVLFNPAPIT